MLKKTVLTVLLFSVFLACPALAWEESLTLKFDDPHRWKQVVQQNNEHGWYMIFVPNGQSKDDWTERFVYRYAEPAPSFTPQAYYEEYVRPFNVGKEFSSRVISQSDKDIVFEWSLSGAKGMADAAELQRFIVGKKACHTVQYTVRAPRIPEKKKKEWIGIFQNATVASEKS